MFTTVFPSHERLVSIGYYRVIRLVLPRYQCLGSTESINRVLGVLFKRSIENNKFIVYTTSLLLRWDLFWWFEVWSGSVDCLQSCCNCRCLIFCNFDEVVYCVCTEFFWHLLGCDGDNFVVILLLVVVPSDEVEWSWSGKPLLLGGI